jgi:hypothetical protein
VKKRLIAAAVLLILPTAAQATPGMGDEVYGAETTAGETELEARYGALAGGPTDGAEALKLEASYAVNGRLRIAALGEFTRDPFGPRKFEAAGVEAIYRVGTVGGIGVAVYGEYEVAFNGTDKVETKLILQRRKGPLDIRFNLIAEKPLSADQAVELGYAASVDFTVFRDVSLGARAFGNLGTFSNRLPYAEHYVGPVVKVGIDGLGPEVELEAGYLFAVGKAKQDTNGQVRIMLGVEF